MSLGIISIVDVSVLALVVLALVFFVVCKIKLLRRFKVSARLSKLSIDIEVDAQTEPTELPPGAEPAELQPGRDPAQLPPGSA